MRRFNGPTLDVGALTGWDDVRIFLAVATSPSFSVAAHLLGTTPSTITRRIAIIERRAHINLFRRQATGIELTEAGTALVAVAREMADAAGRFQEQLMRLTDDVHGTIRISAPEGFANYLLPQFVTKLKERYPNLTIRIVTHRGASIEISDHADLFLIGTSSADGVLNDRDLISRPVGRHRFTPYAHRDYVRQTNASAAGEHVFDLTRCDLIQHSEYEYFSSFVKWNNLIRESGKSGSLIVVDSTTGIIQMLRESGGISLLPTYSRHLRPELVPVATSFPAQSFGLFVVAAKERYQNKAVQTAFDFLVNIFNDRPSWFGGTAETDAMTTREAALAS